MPNFWVRSIPKIVYTNFTKSHENELAGVIGLRYWDFVQHFHQLPRRRGFLGFDRSDARDFVSNPLNFYSETVVKRALCLFPWYQTEIFFTSISKKYIKIGDRSVWEIYNNMLQFFLDNAYNRNDRSVLEITCNIWCLDSLTNPSRWGTTLRSYYAWEFFKFVFTRYLEKTFVDMIGPCLSFHNKFFNIHYAYVVMRRTVYSQNFKREFFEVPMKNHSIPISCDLQTM